MSQVNNSENFVLTKKQYIHATILNGLLDFSREVLDFYLMVLMLNGIYAISIMEYITKSNDADLYQVRNFHMHNYFMIFIFFYIFVSFTKWFCYEKGTRLSNYGACMRFISFILIEVLNIAALSLGWKMSQRSIVNIMLIAITVEIITKHLIKWKKLPFRSYNIIPFWNIQGSKW